MVTNISQDMLFFHFYMKIYYFRQFMQANYYFLDSVTISDIYSTLVSPSGGSVDIDIGWFITLHRQAAVLDANQLQVSAMVSVHNKQLGVVFNGITLEYSKLKC